ncbi:hypothetical protein pmac_cds_884 [Pandoravirus macleodensis]|uniref:Uncharacterized protein n=1 Tax=Pandoravirus macleodensis TaxID=2107707 RepID=A0A2U7UGL0_9VIRU|nr:hypothetical protein pmac_cds_884 [Pandoravirus macleodensis]AVK77572.1 hypothetical protein pmac_cds_884 [Pandoravirus macleodensis]
MSLASMLPPHACSTKDAQSVANKVPSSTPPTNRIVAESTVAGFIVPGLLVVELQRVPYADPLSSLGTHVSDIVSTAARNLNGADMGDVRLMAAYIMDRRAPDESSSSHGAPKEHTKYLSLKSDGNGGGNGGSNSDDDICTLLCVASSSVGGSSHWVGLDMQCSRESPCPRGRRPRRGRKWFSISVAPASLIGCFTRHASINASGAIDRRDVGPAGCTTCARTWSGFALAIARTQSRERVNAARLAALTAASLQARRSFRCEAGIVDVLCAGVVAIKEVAPLMQPSDPRLQRAERALSVLARYVEGALMLCLWAERFHATEAKRIIGDADARAATALPEAAPRLRRAADVLDSVVAVAVAAGVIIARANVAAAEAVCAAAGFNGSPVTFTHMRDALSGLSLAAVLDQSEADMADWARRASACFMSARKATIEAAIKATAAAAAAQTKGDEALREHEKILLAKEDRGRHDCPTRERDPVSTKQGVPDLPTTLSVDIAATTTTTTLVCASSECHAEGRRIVSGCVVAADCDAHCSVPFHRSCWEAAHIVLNTDGDGAGAPCATPDCTGRIVRVTSTRLRAVDRPRRILWQASKERCPQRSQCAPPSTDRAAKQEDDCGGARAKSRRRQQRHPYDRSSHAHPQQRQCESIDDGEILQTPVRKGEGNAQGSNVGDALLDDGMGADGAQVQANGVTTRKHQHASPVQQDSRATDSTLTPTTTQAAPQTPTTTTTVAITLDTTTPLVNATVYKKQRQSREQLPLKRKRPRDRTGRRQRCHVAAQQRQQLLVMAGLAESPTNGASDTEATEDATPPNPLSDDNPTTAAITADDDALWPCFFVPDRV